MGFSCIWVGVCGFVGGVMWFLGWLILGGFECVVDLV